MNNACIILAAGIGKRMNSTYPKVLQRVYGVPMIQSIVSTAMKLKPKKIVLVAGQHLDKIKETVKSKEILFVLQKHPKGTAHALLCASKVLKDLRGVNIVLNGDTPLVRPATIKKLLNLHRKNKNVISVLSFMAKNPENYGRIIRNDSGRVLSIIEDKDADPVQKKIHEVNSGIYAINYNAFYLLDKIKINRSKEEYYLTDIIGLSSRKGLAISAYCIGSEEELMGVNTKEELHRASSLMKEQIIKKWIKKGVNLLDPDSVYIHPDVLIGNETTIYPNVYIEGHSKIGNGTLIYPNVRIHNSSIGNKVTIKDSTIIEDSRVKDRASVGPFAHIRPGSEIGSDSRIGNFVELKKAVIGNKTRASHLTYLGDTTIGKGVNIGAGTITCNYDGKKKHRTIIDDNVFVGSDSQLIAPVKVGKSAYIGAGSTITKDVPARSLALSRAKQKNLEDWTKKRPKGKKVRSKNEEGKKEVRSKK
jgi:bifunctional UDP-N-acetylglucosamine pyrophosphorylase/glucosamine-1-phosphate N-acetyltransferase